MIETLYLYSISDGIEIALCITAYYMINNWLYTQETKELLKMWYGYHVLIIFSYFFDLQTVFFLSACCFPLVLMLAIIYNEQKLQKMFVTAQRLDPLTTTTATSHWLDELIKFALVRLNEKNDLYVIIEYQDNLAPFINATHVIHADLKKNTLELLYDSFIMPKESFLWIASSPTSKTGKIISLAAYWKNIKLDETVQITCSTDCIALKMCATTRTFMIIAGSKIIENLSAQHALNILYELQKTVYKKENNHAIKDNFTTYNNTHFS
ncbi:MAG: hypothetical protein K2X90_00725 [Candidatus Babeliaceae bacterium]|nr:hypothetical protein [Candidatus Babeliaceae bacterium]